MVITGNELHLKVKIQFNLEAWIDSCGGFFFLFFFLLWSHLLCTSLRFTC